VAVLKGWTCSRTKYRDPSRLSFSRFTSKRVKTRFNVKFPSMGPPICNVIPDNNFVNAERAMAERLLMVKGKDGCLCRPPQPRVGIFERRLAHIRKRLIKLSYKPIPMTKEQFLSRYGPRRRAMYENALKSLETKPLTKRDAHVDFFVKAENTNLTAKPDSVPRGISPRGPRFCVELGPYIQAAEKAVYEAIARLFRHPTVMKGMNALEQGRVLREKWDMFKDPVAVGLDASRFDQHVSHEALKFEHSVWLKILNLTKEQRVYLQWLLNNQLVNKIFCNVPDGKLKCKLCGCRMSGDMNTGCGNCLLMCLMVYAYIEYKKIKATLANNGDDCVVIMERKDLKHFLNGLSEWFLDMGFNMTQEEPVYDFERVEFCQTKPIWTEEGWVMCRDHFKGRAKDCSVFTVRSQADYESIMTSVGSSGLALAGGIPVFQEFYASILRAGRGRAEKKGVFDEINGRKILARGMDRKYKPIHEKTRYSYWLAFGITPALQVEIENYYRQHTPYFAPFDVLDRKDGRYCDPSLVWEGYGVS